MKSTGIIRRVDDLGRIVIPKGIRKQCDIHEGEALEIYVDEINSMPCVCLVKYSTKFSNELNRVKENIANEMDCCGENELSVRSSRHFPKPQKFLKNLKKE